MNNGVTLWMTGLSGAGKTTLALALEQRLRIAGYLVERLDGDTIREGLSRDLGFSKEDRQRNIERVTFVAKLLSRNGVITLVSLISPYQEMRELARKEISNFVEIYVKCPLNVCVERDVKGLYKKALVGEIAYFTGVSDPYEPPINPELTIETAKYGVKECVDQILYYLESGGYIKY